MTIPVRVPAEMRATVAQPSVMSLTPEHPLFNHPCPVCDQPLSTWPIILVYVGCEDPIEGKLFKTGASVAVHKTCAEG